MSHVHESRFFLGQQVDIPRLGIAFTGTVEEITFQHEGSTVYTVVTVELGRFVQHKLPESFLMEARNP